MKIADLAEAEKVLARFVFSEGRELYTLDRMHRLMELVGNPQNKLRVVHIAGTAGKTSTSYFIAKMLQLSGQTVGLTVSPHISTVNERVQVNGQPLPEAEFCNLLAEFLSIEGVTELNPRYFEVLVGFAFWVFAQKKVDYAVVEVGLGGLLDGTNVIERSDKICVITDIGFDHTHILGKTLTQIAAQKAGIIQKGNACFMLKQSAEVVNTIEQYAMQQSATLHVLKQLRETPKDLPIYQQRNWSLAKQVFNYIAARDKLTKSNFDKESWTVPGRMEKVGNFMLDGAHNPGKMRALVDSLWQQYPNQKFNIIIGMIETKKDYVKDVISLLQPLTNQMFCVPAHASQDIPHAPLDPEEISQVARQAGLTKVEALPDLAGSLYLLGPAKDILLKS